MEEEYSLQDILKIIRGKLWLIFGLAFLFAVIAALISYFLLNPIYQSETEIIVKQQLAEGQGITAGEIQTNLNLVTTYSGIIQSPAILDKVREELKLEDLGDIQVQSSSDSQIVKIIVKTTDPNQSAIIANEIANVFQQEIVEIMNVNSVYILSEAEVNPSPVEPNPLLNIAIAIVLGIIVGVLIAFVLDYFDNRIKDESDLDEIAEDTLLGVISTLATAGKANNKRSKRTNSNNKKIRNKVRTIISLKDPDSIYAEEYRNVRTSIELSMFNEDLRSIVVTSPNAAEGKSTTAANLGVAFAQHGKKVLLVETDFRKPTVHYTFASENIKGLSNVLSGQETIQNTVKYTEEQNLDILTSGPILPNPAKLIGSKNMIEFIKEAEQLYDIVIFDTPPLLPVADARLLIKLISNVVLVVRNEHTEKKAAKRAVEMIGQAKGNLLGMILNDKIMTEDKYYYYGYKQEKPIAK